MHHNATIDKAVARCENRSRCMRWRSFPHRLRTNTSLDLCRVECAFPFARQHSPEGSIVAGASLEPSAAQPYQTPRKSQQSGQRDLPNHIEFSPNGLLHQAGLCRQVGFLSPESVRRRTGKKPDPVRNRDSIERS